jgi:hypothetical protein
MEKKYESGLVERLSRTFSHGTKPEFPLPIDLPNYQNQLREEGAPLPSLSKR